MNHKLISSISNSTLSPSLVLTVALLSTTTLRVVGRDLQRRSAGTESMESWSDGKQWIRHMCNAQCDAFCNENAGDCRRICKANDTRSWIIKCHESEHEVQSSLYDIEDSYRTRSSECPGTCSILRDQEEAGYFIPLTPEVVLVRDLSNHSVTLTWSRPATDSAIVYVVQEKEESGPQHLRQWTEAHLVLGGDHFTRHYLTVCSKPTYRVAAVSRYGSHWFSEEVTTPDMVPGSPQQIRVGSIRHDVSINSFVVTIIWQNPTGWELPDLKSFKPFTWQNYVKCPLSLPRVFAFEDKHSYSNNQNTLTFHIADFAVGCKVIYAVSATSKCSDDLVSDRAYITIDLSCQSVKDFYSGVYCTPPPASAFNPPGRVENVQITVVPGREEARAHVTWAPPTHLGSAGKLGFFVVFYGFVDPDWPTLGFQDNIYHNITLPPDTLEADVPVLRAGDPDGAFGILVMAGAEGQVIDRPIGIMHVVQASFPDGRVLLDEDIVVYQITETNEVRVFWNPPPPSEGDVTGAVLQWGPLSKRQHDVPADADDAGGPVTYNRTGPGVELHVSNTTVISETGQIGPRD